MQYHVSMRKLLVLATLVCLITMACLQSESVHAQQLGSIHQGRRLAQRLCAQCHLVDDVAGRSNNAAAPTFAAIAQTPGLTERALTAALQTSHRTMPNIVIKGADINDIVAYILSLKGND
jgi:mono/diheme cytochrome c family protein